MQSANKPIPVRSAHLNRWPAWMDMAQGATGLILVLFMWTHMFLVSSILLGKDAMYFVARLFEGEPMLGKPYPILVSLFAVFILTLIVVHAVLALRKFPNSASQYRTLHQHLGNLKHADSSLWYVQVLTGFALFFLASVHLYQLITHPADIGPYASSDRVWSGRVWPLYLILLFVVELHAGIGIYRLVIKWGLFLGDNAKRNRKILHSIKWALTIFFIVLGLFTLGAYMKIGAEHADRVGERYVPSYHQTESNHQIQTDLQVESDADAESPASPH
ncbi:fumarate reductase cytochrome b subunit [Teredinibacter waterburyi]|uniref:fumarate reductase cytochrome b subunit n=1 Tax=Teredinibacter waterburyi TaxID=1500538 RepID=UPI00165F3BFB|nr:fumarate reductase cytochrome b subunit [Teredinibacter waterburyi]